jgi:hypothetical protein
MAFFLLFFSPYPGFFQVQGLQGALSPKGPSDFCIPVRISLKHELGIFESPSRDPGISMLKKNKAIHETEVAEGMAVE